MENLQKSPCCPELKDGKKCDYLDFVYRLNNFTEVNLERPKQTVTVPVEVSLHVRIERCTGGLQLGNVVYSTTLLPGERVRLFSMDRKSRFSFDSESQLSYRHEQSAEEQFYLESFESFMSDLTSKDDSQGSSSSSGSSSTSASTSGLLGTIVNGPSASIKGSFNASATMDFLRELHVHSEASHNKSVQMTRETSAVQVGEVQTRTHAEGESESHVESSSRLFKNDNQCHAVSYLFYQVDKVQTVKISIRAVNTRIIDPAGDTAVVNRPIFANPKLSVLPTAVLATSDKANLKLNEAKFIASERLVSSQPLSFSAASFGAQQPLNSSVRTAALNQVRDDLINEKLIDKSGNLTKEVLKEFNIEFTTSIPTPGIVVKGCLDDCNTCEDGRKQSIALDLENKKLQNELLKKQIELLEKSQEYRCCPKDEEEIIEIIEE